MKNEPFPQLIAEKSSDVAPVPTSKLTNPYALVVGVKYSVYIDGPLGDP